MVSLTGKKRCRGAWRELAGRRCQMTREDIAAVIGKIPELSAYGIGYPSDLYRTPEERKAWLREQQARLLGDVDGCSRAEAWLRGKRKRRTVNGHCTSYWLKHVAEKEVGYITNGAFIAAAIHCGFRCRINPRSPNPYFDIEDEGLESSKGRKRIRQKTGA
jgi:hypothetical protein